MNTNPNAIKILCFGDSNTWGFIPVTEERYPVNVRWTGLLQMMLGEKYWIIEEGLNGRTTDVEDMDSPGKNGLEYLHPCLKTHNPIDIIILMLGTNDTKHKFQRTAEEIANGIGSLLNEIMETGVDKDGNTPRIILISPPLVNDTNENALAEFKNAGKRSKQFFHSYEPIAADFGIPVFDASSWVRPCEEDGVHLNPKDHRIIAEKLFHTISTL